MRKMSFMNELTDFLISTGAIYTVRKYRMLDGFVAVEGVGVCRRVFLSIIGRKEELYPYVDKSGFNTIDAWWDKIKYFIPKDTDVKYLYKVEN